MKKKILKDLLIFIVLICLLALTGCEEKEVKTENKTVKMQNAIEYYEIEKKDVTVTADTNKWPSGVYDEYGIPKCTQGKLVYAMPNSEIGEVFYKATAADLKAYVNKLIDAGFRMNSNHLATINKAPKDLNMEIKIYSPNVGDGYVLNIVYTNKDNGKGVDALIKADPEKGIEKDAEFFYNMYIKVEPKAYSKKLVHDDLLTYYGISNEVMTPKFDFATIIRDAKNPEAVTIKIDIGYDKTITEDDILNYKRQIAEEIQKISDDKKIYTYDNEEISVDNFIDFRLDELNYNYKGKSYLMLFELTPEIGEIFAVTLFKNPEY